MPEAKDSTRAMIRAPVACPWQNEAMMDEGASRMLRARTFSVNANKWPETAMDAITSAPFGLLPPKSSRG
jgi:hypothetical protein